VFDVDVSVFFFSSRRRHTRLQGDWSSDVCSSDLGVRFTLDNLDGTAPVLRIVKLTGDGQTATVGAAYAAPVRVKVTDAKGAAVAGHAVVFALPDSGASAVFDGGTLAAQAVTDAAGVAASPALRANGRSEERRV